MAFSEIGIILSLEQLKAFPKLEEIILYTRRDDKLYFAVKLLGELKKYNKNTIKYFPYQEYLIYPIFLKELTWEALPCYQETELQLFDLSREDRLKSLRTYSLKFKLRLGFISMLIIQFYILLSTIQTNRCHYFK